MQVNTSSLLAVCASVRTNSSLLTATCNWTSGTTTRTDNTSAISHKQQSTSTTIPSFSRSYSSAATATASVPPSPPNGRISAMARPSDDGKAANTYFPLGYKDGFSQWWAGLAPAVTEHRVLSYVPHLQQPPTHLQTGATAPAATDSAAAADMTVDTSAAAAAAPVRTNRSEDPYGPRQWQSRMVELSGKNRFLNEFSVARIQDSPAAARSEASNAAGSTTATTAEEAPHQHSLVMLHGYGAGLGFFYKNFEPLSRRPDWKLYALDMLGMGRSSRPPFRIYAKEKEARTREAESWFVDALEEWRQQQGIEKMTLLGHSMGGYLAVCYALKYPGHLNKLILASPVGIPEDPYAVSAELPEPGESTLQAEVTDPAPSTSAAAGQPKPPPRKPLPKWLTTLWDANISPFSLVRLSGPLGPRLVSGWTSRRFAHLPAAEAQALHDYSYSLFRQRGSGEYALAYILAPGAFARSPLIRRIQGVGRQWLEPEPQSTSSSSTAGSVGGKDGAAASTSTDTSAAGSVKEAAGQRLRETGIPVVLMYGEHDWMDVGGGYASEEALRAAQKEALAAASPAERARENGSAKVTIIRKAGHHVYLDGWEQFNDEILAEMRDVETREARLAALR